MKEQKIHRKMMAYLYDEMPESERVSFEKWLDSNPDRRKELSSFGQIRTVLSLSGENSNTFSPKNTESTTKTTIANSTASQNITLQIFATAAGLLVVFFLGGYLSGFQLNVSDDGFRAGFGFSDQDSITKVTLAENLQETVALAEREVTNTAEVRDELIQKFVSQDSFDKARQEQLFLMAELLNEERQLQQKEIRSLIETFVVDFEARRLTDLQLIVNELEFQRELFSRQTHEQDLVINEIIEFVTQQYDR
ncbi:MAG: hypothetical protein LAT67_10790 [Balneolales bacterium]|nr:hypothetical protein [Balneolales bacterium]